MNTLVEIVNLISTPEIEEQYGGRSTRGMRLEKPLEESVKLNEQVVKVREVGSKYQKVQVFFVPLTYARCANKVFFKFFFVHIFFFIKPRQ